MQKLVDTVNSFYGSGIPPQAKIFKLSFGQYQDRVVLVYAQTPNELVYTWADPPYLNWSAPVSLATDSADYPCSGFMDSGGNLYVVYTQQTTLSLIERKLSFSQGSWSLGTANTVCNVAHNHFPNIIKDSTGRLWVSWTYYDPDSERYFIHVKTSVNDGATWGTGPSDPGTILTNGSWSCYSQLVFQPPYVHCFYSDDSTLLAYRSHEIQASGWNPQQTIYSGSAVDDSFCADLSSDNRLGIVFPGSSALLYKEFDGSNWSGALTVDACLPRSVAIGFLDSVPYVFFAKDIGNGQNQLFYSHKEGASFASPACFEAGQKPFNRVFCYDDSASAKFSDRTTPASDSTAADIFHPTSGGLVEDIDDALFLGMDVKFNLARVVLSTAGIGGVVKWQYWKGEEWFDFVPQSGNHHLSSQTKTVILWQDLNSAPSDWQTCPVNGISEFWVRILVTTAFATAPVGTQITAVPEIKHLKAFKV
ncbi:MAG: hypothetical protein WCE90_03950 [Candidatus Zixiibacteriota bacterium]